MERSSIDVVAHVISTMLALEFRFNFLLRLPKEVFQELQRVFD